MSHLKKNPVSAKAIDASVKLVDKARQPFTQVTRLTDLERKHAAKLKRGAQQVIPAIARIARKFAIEIPGHTIDEMLSEIEKAQSLEPLLGAVGDFYATLRDESLRAQSVSWKTATATYGMLKKAAEVNQSISTELEPVQKWFRPRAKSAPSAPAPTTTDSPPAKADAKPASTSKGVNGVVDGSASAHA